MNVSCGLELYKIIVLLEKTASASSFAITPSSRKATLSSASASIIEDFCFFNCSTNSSGDNPKQNCLPDIRLVCALEREMPFKCREIFVRADRQQ